MTSALVHQDTSGPVGLAYDDGAFAQFKDIAECVAAAEMAPSMAVALAKILRGAPLGMDPIEAQRAFYDFRDKDNRLVLGMWTAALVGLAEQAGVQVTVTHDPSHRSTADKSYAEVEAKLPDGRTISATYTMAEAEAINLPGRWRKMGQIPEHMLRLRATSRLVEGHLTRYTRGIPAAESLRDETPEVITPTEVKVVDPVQTEEVAKEAAAKRMKADKNLTVARAEELRKKLEEALEGDTEEMGAAWQAGGLPETIEDGPRLAGVIDTLDKLVNRAPHVLRYHGAIRDLHELSTPIPNEALINPWTCQGRKLTSYNAKLLKMVKEASNG